MTEKEFHRMRPQDLVQLLLAQGAEVASLHEDLEKKIEKLGLLQAENDALKVKLDESDAGIELIKKELDESDAYIRELEEEMAALRADQWIEIEETGSLIEAAKEIMGIFEAAQKEAERYLSGELPPDCESLPKRPEHKPLSRKKKRAAKPAPIKAEGSMPAVELEKEEAKPLKSDRKTTDKEKETHEEAKLQQPKTKEEEPWPDEMPSGQQSQEAAQDLWPDEAALADWPAAGAHTAETDGARQKGLFRSLRWGKNRHKKEKPGGGS